MAPPLLVEWSSPPRPSLGVNSDSEMQQETYVIHGSYVHLLFEERRILQNLLMTKLTGGNEAQRVCRPSAAPC